MVRGRGRGRPTTKRFSDPRHDKDAFIDNRVRALSHPSRTRHGRCGPPPDGERGVCALDTAEQAGEEGR